MAFADLGGALRGPLGPLRLGDVLTLALMVIAVIGFAYHISYIQRPGYIGRMADTHPEVWATAMLLFYAAQVSIRLRWAPSACVPLALVVFGLLTIENFMTFLLYAIGASPSAASFFFFCSFVAGAVTVLLLLSPTATPKAPSTESAPPLPHREDDVESPAVPEPAAASRPHSFSDADAAAAASAEQKDDRSACTSCFLCYNCFNTAIVILFSTLLMVGAGYQAQSVGYPLEGRGQLLEAGGYNIAYNCEGPTNSGRPTIIMDCDGSHGMMDFWPLQRAFTLSGRRSCIFDKPGIGWSDLFYADQNLANFSNFYGEMISKFNERPPYTFLAWGGGGSWMFEFAARNPSIVRSFIFLNVYFANVEWRMNAAFHNKTQSEEEDHRQLALKGRNALFGIIRGLGIPWGLMGIFVAPNRSSYKWPERFEEQRWFYMTGKTWTTQFFFFDLLRTKGEDPATTINGVVNPLSLGEMPRIAGLLAGRPIMQIASNRSTSVICKGVANAAPGSEACDELVFNERFLAVEAGTVCRLTGNCTYVPCLSDDCSLTMPYEKPDFIVDAVNRRGAF